MLLHAIETAAEVVVIVAQELRRAARFAEDGQLPHQPAKLDIGRQRVHPLREEQRPQQGRGLVEHPKLIEDQRIALGLAVKGDAAGHDLLSEQFQLEPEHSTTAIVVHHPAAKYFNVARAAGCAVSE